MKSILFIAIIAAAIYFFYPRFQSNASIQIDNPSYAEFRIKLPIANRELDVALFGKMVSEAECRDRAQVVWGKVIESCAQCTMTVSSCKAQLEPRYQKLFDNQAINNSYLAFTAANNSERDGRMVFWGVTLDESKLACEALRTQMKARYAGAIECVAGRVE